MGLSKAFDRLQHCLTLCKLKAYGLSTNSCKLIASYLYKRKQHNCEYKNVQHVFKSSHWIASGSPVCSRTCKLPFDFSTTPIGKCNRFGSLVGIMDNSYPRQLVPRTTRTQDNSYPGQLVPKTTRTQDDSYPRQVVPKTTRTQDSSYPGQLVPNSLAITI